MSHTLDRESQKFGDGVDRVLDPQQRRQYTHRFLCEAAQYMADDQTDIIGETPLTRLVDMALPGDVDDPDTIGLLKNRAGVIAFLANDEAPGYRRFAHSQLFNYFLSTAVIESVSNGEIPKFIRLMPARFASTQSSYLLCRPSRTGASRWFAGTVNSATVGDGGLTRGNAMHIEASGATLGATVREVDLAGLDDATFLAIEEAWHRYAVLVFPDQRLSDDEHLAFTRRFGRLERGLARRHTAGLGRMSNVDKNGRVVDEENLQARFQRGNRDWHTDSSYKRVGAKASILAAHVVPEEGGETEWADMRAGWDALDDSTQRWLTGKIAVHSYRFSHTWHGGLEILNDDDLAALPPVEHPLLRVHPATQRKSLFVGRHASHIVGEDVNSSRQFLRDLTAGACQPPRVWGHRWQPGDIAIWDNRSVLHRGRPWPAGQARVMARSTVAGDDPDNEWAAP